LSRTPYRYTGIYRFDGEMMRAICLHDRKGEDSASLDAVPLGDSFCQFAMTQGGFETRDSGTDPRLEGHAYRGVLNSYYGLPLSISPGTIYGTLCHFDFDPQQISDNEIEFLESVRPILMNRLP
jgi:GAF domain-containing protein